MSVSSGLNLEKMYGLFPGTNNIVHSNEASVLFGCLKAGFNCMSKWSEAKEKTSQQSKPRVTWGRKQDRGACGLCFDTARP